MKRIAHLFGVSAIAILKWISTLGTKLCLNIEPFPDDKVIVMEVHELWHHYKKKKQKFVFLKPMIVIANDVLIGHVVRILMAHSKNSLTDSEHGKFYYIARDD